ncbi:MAG: histidine kinase [Bacteroidales bacterium]
MIKSPLRAIVTLSFGSSLIIGVLALVPMFIAIKPLPFIFYFSIFLLLFINLISHWLINFSLVVAFKSVKQKHLRFSLRYLASYISTIVISGCFISYVVSSPEMQQFFANHGVVRDNNVAVLTPYFMAAVINTFVIFMMEFVILQVTKSRVEIENAQLKIDNAEAQNIQLMQYIQPHFLFNSLSVLKSLIRTNPQLAERYILRLSDFLRVSIASSQENVLNLQDELKMCKDYIEMQKMRFGEALNVIIDIPANLLLTKVVPRFSLQLLLENAIKHNAFTKEKPLNITIEKEGGYLSVNNNVQKKEIAGTSLKSGLANLSKRYKAICEEDIVIEENEQFFKVYIKLIDLESYKLISKNRQI